MTLTPLQRQFLYRLSVGARLPSPARDEDRARQLCRRNGLAEVLQSPRRWSITPAGLTALTEAPQ